LPTEAEEPLSLPSGTATNNNDVHSAGDINRNSEQAIGFYIKWIVVSPTVEDL
jgi:hypothetical protein